MELEEKDMEKHKRKILAVLLLLAFIITLVLVVRGLHTVRIEREAWRKNTTPAKAATEKVRIFAEAWRADERKRVEEALR